MNIDQDETDAMLLHLTMECARPSWRFRLLFGARERQLLGFAINTFMGQRQQNLLMRKLDERYGGNRGLSGVGTLEQQPPAQQARGAM